MVIFPHCIESVIAVVGNFGTRSAPIASTVLADYQPICVIYVLGLVGSGIIFSSYFTTMLELFGSDQNWVCPLIR